MSEIDIHVEDPEFMPLCLLCDQPIYRWDQCEIAVAFDMKALVHSECTLEEP